MYLYLLDIPAEQQFVLHANFFTFLACLMCRRQTLRLSDF